MSRASQISPANAEDKVYPQLDALLDVLRLMADQAWAYERSLPYDNTPARLAVATLSELARQALTEAEDLRDSLDEIPSIAEHPFSPREAEVLTLAAHGLTNKEIAF